MTGKRKSIRRRRRELNKLKKAKIKIHPLDVILIIGLTLAFIGTIIGGLSYFYYTGGKSEGVIHTPYEGTFHVNEEPPGKPEHISAAFYYTTAAVIGYSLSAIAWIAKFIRKKLKPAETVTPNTCFR